MRLVHSITLNLRSFAKDQVPDYVILSHRWFGDEELTFEDLRDCSSTGLHGDVKNKQGYEKLRGACNQAAQDGYEWIWIDSCCIDRSSSAELQESINSMWGFYARANICYAYLSDVADADSGWDEAFSESDWWSRGWTLQELLAPDSVEFYARDWTPIGTRAERHEEIVSITGISQNALTKELPMDGFSAAEIFSWAAHRQVTREEDESYALLGLFEVNIPLLMAKVEQKRLLDFKRQSILQPTTPAFSSSATVLTMIINLLLRTAQQDFVSDRIVKPANLTRPRTFLRQSATSLYYREIVGPAKHTRVFILPSLELDSRFRLFYKC